MMIIVWANSVGWFTTRGGDPCPEHGGTKWMGQGSPGSVELAEAVERASRYAGRS